MIRPTQLWPFQCDLTEHIEKFKEKTFEVYLPEQLSPKVAMVCAAAFIAAGIVFAIDRWTRTTREIASDAEQANQAD